jgi:hypothetical protein
MRVSFRNNGNIAVEDPFQVTFYSDANRQQLLGTVVIDPLVRGCTLKSYTAALELPGLTPGNYPFWATVDSQNDIQENPADNVDNRISGVLLVPVVPFYDLELKIFSNGQGEGGTVSVSPEGPSYAAASEVTLTAVAKTGWKFLRYSGDVKGSNPVKKFTMDADKLVKATFVQDQYDFNVLIEGKGAVTRDLQKDGYAYGDIINLTAEPNDGWHFSHWLGDVQRTWGNRARVVISGDTNVKAVFTKHWIQFPLTLGSGE